jgi:hypothetical protein
LGKRHHFVPRFLLRAFALGERRIHVFNINRARAVEAVSLRHQCYANRLYGSDELERALADIECAAAPVIATIAKRRCLPQVGSEEYAWLVTFIGLQLARTPAARSGAMRMSDALADAAFDGSPPDDFRLSTADAMELMMGVGPELALTIGDLRQTLVVSSGRDFWISDNPAFKYNRYCEGIKYFGVTGTKSRGLQIFLPIAPELLLMLYDATVYKVGSRRASSLVVANPADVAQLNRLQATSAESNLYFRSWKDAAGLATTIASVRRQRDESRPRVTRAVDSENSRSELLHQYWRMPNLGVELSFVAIQRNARRIPLFERSRQVRGPYKKSEPRANAGGTVRRFEVRAPRR